MHGLLLSIKTVTDLIRVLPVGFPILFSTDASCNMKSDERRPLECEPQYFLVFDDALEDTSPHPTLELSVFKDPDGRFTTFMNNSRISGIINEYFGYLSLDQHGDYLSNEANIREIVAMKLYYACNATKDKFLNEDGSPKDEAVQELKTYLWESKLTTISTSGFGFNYVPIKAWKFLTDHCETEELWIEKTTIDIDALNNPDLSNITALFLFDVGLTEIPCLYNLTGLEYLCLNNNKIVEVSLQNYFDAETGIHRTMPNLKCLSLHRNRTSNIDPIFKDVFPNKLMAIILDQTVLYYPFSDMKDELEQVYSELIEPGEKKKHELDVTN
ncbi:uncharacterized protein VICG_00855 [Vittaforma corneae ATCC 50505]|uniref:U2A'/phosphoprotein 32 family A C-terminal domain-containing protein n=1 Tax=Vittaforma corneae (strain ATCC 50505) TaxID=993615 RepID=L2GPI2_VITCO|nr:uncharacterized protein VICG_00855 [Vittaforma corneae ATCC 50505]ELA42212.1 hypothetical protein VICG_00855 [Vittaforma corneae ATCC 50505]